MTQITSLLRPAYLAPAFLAIVTLVLGTAAAAAEAPRDVVFDVYRNGSAFGEHAVRFTERQDGQLEVDIDIALRVGFGPVTVFRYEHEAEEVWNEGELVSMTAETLKEGRRQRFSLVRDAEGRFVKDGETIDPLVPSSHWSCYMAGLPAVLNTETGEPMPVEIEDLGMSEVETGAGPVMARHLRMTGTLSVDLWYDETGRWVGCAFTIDNQNIQYRLRNA